MNKKQYAFLVGSNAPLSIAEIYAVFQDADIVTANKAFIIIITTKEIQDIQQTLDSLGGTIKIYEILSTSSDVQGSQKSVFDAVRHFLQQKNPTSKVSFAINFFGKKDTTFQKKLIFETKEQFKENGISCRFVNKNFKNTTSVQSFHEKLATKGLECGIFFDINTNRQWIGTLAAVQNIEEYSYRDYGKPQRNMKIGLMPPKLAQIMINLSGLPKGKTIYDPFCGTGGILLESMLMGYHFFGSDIHEEALKQACTNIEWGIQNLSLINALNKSFLKQNIFIQDAMKLDKVSFAFDAIVTESYLGPVLQKKMKEEEIFSMEKHLNTIYTRFFEKLGSHVSFHTPIIITLPVFFIHGRPYYLRKTLEKILELGYTASALIPEAIQKKLNIYPMRRNSILYHREGQFVGREIFRLYKK